ncbi:MAG: hypothetical protein E6Q97_25235 [Desulfurellales bacterium]|nr:MAG: hypothetical protein E6Q97_25235 [Desulfurellales bacterium]
MTAIPQRPNLIPEQLRSMVAERLGNQPIRFNREQTLQFLVMLAANLEQLLNDDVRLPLVDAHIDKHDNGFRLNVELKQPSTTDIEL